MATCERVDQGNVTILRLKGALTGEGLEQVQQPFEQVTHAKGARVVVDLTEVAMVTTPAISMFIAAALAARETGGRVVFTESQPPVRDILKRLRLHAILHTVPGIAEAITEARA